MSTVHPPPRARRGRVLIVEDALAPEQLGGSWAPSAVRVSNLFEAIGEVAAAPAGKPIIAAVVAAERVGDAGGRLAAALRQIDPSLKLILVGDGDQSAGATADADDDLVGPVAADDVRRILDDESRQTPTQTVEPTIRVVHRPEPAGAQEGSSRPAPLDPGPQEPLGDTDLVEAMLNDSSGVLDTALRLMAQQTRWTDVALTEDPTPSPGAAGAEATYGRHRFGRLTCPEATTDQLRPWADWLARWLALDRAFRDFRLMAFQDTLTGAWNRRFFDAFLRDSVAKAAQRRRPVTVMVFDIDDFKRYNDEFSHEAGDEILRETVRLLNSVIRKGDRVCRIGGDEFAVIFADPEAPRAPGSTHPETVEQIARRFQDQVCRTKFPKLGLEAPGTLSISGGLATYPWDGTDPDQLRRHADQLALESKRKGKNVITFGPGARREQVTESRSDEVTE